MGKEVVAAGLEVPRAPRSAPQGRKLDDDDTTGVGSFVDPFPSALSVKLVELEVRRLLVATYLTLLEPDFNFYIEFSM